MKPVMTFLCSLFFAIAGISLAINENNNSTGYSQNAIHASTLPYIEAPKLPLDVQLDLEKKYTKTDTVYVPQELMVVAEKSKSITKSRSAHTRKSTVSKRQELRSPVVEPDTLMKSQVCGDREEYTPDTIGPPKESIILIVDGEEVYKR
jgi:hypothetical protein